nr:translation initiation factor IF-2-like [Aegilops tauschii subsp. strangulata]
MDQPTSAVKKKETAATPGAQQPATAAPPLVRKDGGGSHASAAGSTSRDSEVRPQEKEISKARPAPEAPAPSSPTEAPKAQEPPASSAAANLQALVPMLSPPLPITPLGHDPSASLDALEEALPALTQLREDLQGTDRRLASGCLELISGWLRSDASVRAALSQAIAASGEGERAAGLAAAARDMALRDVESAKERRRSAEAELETMRNERTVEACQREAWEEKIKAREDAAAERSCLEELEKKVEAEKAQLEAKAKVLVEDRAAFKSLELKSREALRELYGKGLKKPLVTDEEGPAELLPQLVTTLEGVVNGIGPMVDGEARALSASALTRVFSHLHLRDPSVDLDALLELMDEEHCEAAAQAVKDRVEALLQKFLAIDPAPPADGAADLAARRTAQATTTLSTKGHSLRALTVPKAEEKACWSLLYRPPSMA